MAIEKLQVYKCKICGNIIEVLHAGKPALVCCGKPMTLLKENITDAAKEKHVPVVETSNGKVVVKVGSTAHPMEDKHYIEWIELIADDKVYLKFLNPGDAPQAEFEVATDDSIVVRAYCNLHGLWKA